MDDERMEAWWGRRAWALFSAVHARASLVQCSTNLVSMDIAANVLLSASASPTMLHYLREVRDFTPRCDAVYINVGTLSEDWLPSMRAAASMGRPWVLDPVAAAASGFWMEACLSLLALRPAIVRGNASKILALAARSANFSSSFKEIFCDLEESEVLYIPGVLTSTEVITAYNAGAKVVKVYPVSVMGGEMYMSALKKPFPLLPMVASQGITIGLINSYMEAGASAMVLSEAIFDKELMRERKFGEISELAHLATVQASQFKK